VLQSSAKVGLTLGFQLLLYTFSLDFESRRQYLC
jgi:hypothetical protein